MALLAASYCLLWGEEPLHLSTTLHLVALVVGVVVLDMGAQMTQVANQTRIFGLVPAARSRLNTVYMTVYFSGAAIGVRSGDYRLGALEVERSLRAWRWVSLAWREYGMQPAIATMLPIIATRPPKML